MPDGKPSVFRVLIKGTVSDVWNEITRTDEPIVAFFNAQMHVGELRPGARLAMRSPDGRFTVVVGEILEFIGKSQQGIRALSNDVKSMDWAHGR